MNWMDYGIIIIILLSMLWAVKSIRKQRNNGPACNGNCGSCKKSCH